MKAGTTRKRHPVPVKTKRQPGRILITTTGKEGTKPLIETCIKNGKVVQDSWMQDARKRMAEARRKLKLPE